jgi:hypothetical protein
MRLLFKFTDKKACRLERTKLPGGGKVICRERFGRLSITSIITVSLSKPDRQAIENSLSKAVYQQTKT